MRKVCRDRTTVLSGVIPKDLWYKAAEGAIDEVEAFKCRPLVAAFETHENYENVRGLALDDRHYDPIPPSFGTAVQKFIIAAVAATPTALRAAIYGFSSAMRSATFL